MWSGSVVGPAPRGNGRLWSRNLAASCDPACGRLRRQSLLRAEGGSTHAPTQSCPRGDALPAAASQGGGMSIRVGASRKAEGGEPRGRGGREGPGAGLEVGFPFGWSGCPPSKFVTPPQSAPVSACNGRGQTDAAPRRAASATRLASAGGCAWGVMMMEWRFLEWSGDFCASKTMRDKVFTHPVDKPVPRAGKPVPRAGTGRGNTSA